MRIDGHASVLLRMLLLCFFLIMEQLAASRGTADRKRNPCSDHRLIRGHPTSGSVRQHRFPPFHTPGRWLICSALKTRTLIPGKSLIRCVFVVLVIRLVTADAQDAGCERDHCCGGFCAGLQVAPCRGKLP